MDYFNYNRRKSSEVRIGNILMGADNPIRIQSMANVSTMETEPAVEQAIRMIDAGAEIVRFTAQGEREAHNLGVIRKSLDDRGYHTPLVADIHFNPRAADAAAVEVEKVRINPGNYVDRIRTFSHQEYTDEEYAQELQKIRDRLVPFLNICKKHHTAIRIGVNHGSLSDRIMSRYGDTPFGMVESCMEFLRVCRDENFNDVVISIKASNPVVMVKTVRLLVQTMDKEKMCYPLHLGVTEAGDGEDGRIKSAVGIGALMADGIGDTIRVSLTEAPEAEIPVAQNLVNYILERKDAPKIDAKLYSGYDYVACAQRETRTVERIGSGFAPIVISDRTQGNLEFNKEALPDYVYIGGRKAEPLSDESVRLIVDAPYWQPVANVYPLFNASEVEAMKTCNSPIKFLSLAWSELSDDLVSVLKEDQKVVVVLRTEGLNGIGEQRAAIHRLMAAGIDVPVILNRDYKEPNVEQLQLKASADLGALLLDGFGNGIMLQDDSIAPQILDNTVFGILQAAKVRISKTEYISCPSCGRTLYDMQTTIARIKKATSHLKGLKIGIMGCIVNGPGEMADADYGYVGAGRNQISLYKGQKCVLRSIPEEEAVERLVQLIKDNGDWK